jgi:hypothetical protein
VTSSIPSLSSSPARLPRPARQQQQASSPLCPHHQPVANLSPTHHPTRHQSVTNRRQPPWPSAVCQPTPITTRSLVTKLAPIVGRACHLAATCHMGHVHPFPQTMPSPSPQLGCQGPPTSANKLRHHSAAVTNPSPTAANPHGCHGINYHHNPSQPGDTAGTKSCHLAATFQHASLPCLYPQLRCQGLPASSNKLRHHSAPVTNPSPTRHQPVANRRQPPWPSAIHQPSTITTRNLVTKLAPTPATWQPHATWHVHVGHLAATYHVHPFPSSPPARLPGPARQCQQASSPLCRRHQSVTNRRQPPWPSAVYQPTPITTRSLVTKLAPTPAT